MLSSQYFFSYYSVIDLLNFGCRYRFSLLIILWVHSSSCSFKLTLIQEGDNSNRIIELQIYNYFFIVILFALFAFCNIELHVYSFFYALILFALFSSHSLLNLLFSFPGKKSILFKIRLITFKYKVNKKFISTYLLLINYGG